MIYSWTTQLNRSVTILYLRPKTSTNGKYFTLFYPTGISGRTALEDQKYNVRIRFQPVKRTQLLWTQYVPRYSGSEGQVLPALPWRYIK